MPTVPGVGEGLNQLMSLSEAPLLMAGGWETVLSRGVSNDGATLLELMEERFRSDGGRVG